MSETEQEQLHPAVAALARDLDEIDGQWAVPHDRLLEHHLKLKACGPEDRDKLVTDLVVLAARFERESLPNAQIALAQLLALATLILGGVEEAQEAFEGAGVKVGEAKKLIGAEGVKFTDGERPQAGEAAASLLGMLKGNK